MKRCWEKLKVFCTCGCGTVIGRTKYSLKANKPFVVGHWSGRFGPSWRGGKKLVRGYIYVWMPDHPQAIKTGYVLEHRLIMATHLGRPLEKKEIVHHINGNKLDNRVSNLELMTQGQHLHLHNPDRSYGYKNLPRMTSAKGKEIWATKRAHERIKPVFCHTCNAPIIRGGKRRYRVHVFCSRTCYYKWRHKKG